MSFYVEYDLNDQEWVIAQKKAYSWSKVGEVVKDAFEQEEFKPIYYVFTPDEITDLRRAFAWGVNAILDAIAEER